MQRDRERERETYWLIWITTSTRDPEFGCLSTASEWQARYGIDDDTPGADGREEPTRCFSHGDFKNSKLGEKRRCARARAPEMGQVRFWYDVTWPEAGGGGGGATRREGGKRGSRKWRDKRRKQNRDGWKGAGVPFENPEIERAVDRYSNLRAASAAWMATQKIIINIKKKKTGGNKQKQQQKNPAKSNWKNNPFWKKARQIKRRIFLKGQKKNKKKQTAQMTHERAERKGIAIISCASIFNPFPSSFVRRVRPFPSIGREKKKRKNNKRQTKSDYVRHPVCAAINKTGWKGERKRKKIKCRKCGSYEKGRARELVRIGRNKATPMCGAISVRRPVLF